LAALALALVPAAHAHGAFANLGSGCARDDFASGGRSVPAELCRRDGNRAAVVILHGCGGFDTLDHRLAAQLPSHGFATVYVASSAPTPPAGSLGFCGGPRPSFDPFPIWIGEARAAAATLRDTPGIDPRRVGVVGWSLGGGVALGAALAGGKP